MMISPGIAGLTKFLSLDRFGNRKRAADIHDIRPTRQFQKSLYTLHKGIGRSRYMPHQGKRECARRRSASVSVAA